MKIIAIVLVLLVAACQTAPNSMSYKDCMKLFENGVFISQVDRDYCETLNK